MKESTSGTGFGDSRPLGRASLSLPHPATVALPGRRVLKSSADGLRFGDTPCRSLARAARGCSHPSRVAVTGVTSHADATATPSNASGLTANAAHNVFPSAGSGIARLADLSAAVAVLASHNRAAPRTATHASSLAPTPGAPA